MLNMIQQCLLFTEAAGHLVIQLLLGAWKCQATFLAMSIYQVQWIEASIGVGWGNLSLHNLEHKVTGLPIAVVGWLGFILKDLGREYL